MRKIILGFYRFFIRTSAFVSKEMTEVLRQTPLILTLVLGPFLIMLLFGLGYRNEARPLRTMIVMQAGDPTQKIIEAQLATFAVNLIYEGTTPDLNVALQQLKAGNLDMVAVVPPKALQDIQNNQQAVIQFYHNEIDPTEINYVNYFSGVFIDEMNRKILLTYATQGQENASTLDQKLADAHQRVQTLRQSLQAGDAQTAQSEQQKLNSDLDAITMLIGGSISLASGLDPQSSTGNQANVSPQNQAIVSSLSQLQQSQQDIGTIQPGQPGYDKQLTSLNQLDNNLSNLDAELKGFQSIQPSVLVSPFRSEVVGMQKAQLRPLDFFAPAVVVLLLQHLAVTFSALAIVRERRSGSIELFQISPLSAFETLLGKYLSYLLFGGVVAAVLTGTIILFLKIPMVGSWVDYAVVVLTLLFTALGIGFLISLFAQTEMQAVQYAMFVLLGSVFFSGFFLDLRYLSMPVKIVSWLLPATYAIRMLQAVMLRGAPVEPVIFTILLGIGVFLLIITWSMLRRRLQQEWS